MPNAPQTPWYQKARRRILVDMHIGDWDPGFLAKYSSREMVENYKRAGADAVMFYCQSHVGLCNWPTKSGKQHANLAGRNLVAESVELLREAGIASCAYYSAIFNNWAFLEHPEWRMIPEPKGRYGMCCPDNEGYREFCRRQLNELVRGYGFDGLYIDMTYWESICQCPSCRDRFRMQHGGEIPQTINWFDKDWCALVSAREMWMDDFEAMLVSTVKAIRPDLPMYHNFATAFLPWVLGVSFERTRNHDFLGGDFYGDPIEQVLAGKLLRNITRNCPPEFQTSRCHTGGDHERTKSAARLQAQAAGMVLHGGAFMIIDAINPDGTINPPVYERMRGAFDLYARYQPFMGGEALEDVAVYFSGDSKMNFSHNGRSAVDAPRTPMPHHQAVRSWCRILTQAHLPFGVITRQHLADLSRYKVVILPNVLRMSREEVEAIRQYVAGGGSVYASRYTSLVQTQGVLHGDFMLADVFGCHYGGFDAGRRGLLQNAQPGTGGVHLPAALPQPLCTGMGRDRGPGHSGNRGPCWRDGAGQLRASLQPGMGHRERFQLGQHSHLAPVARDGYPRHRGKQVRGRALHILGRRYRDRRERGQRPFAGPPHPLAGERAVLIRGRHLPRGSDDCFPPDRPQAHGGWSAQWPGRAAARAGGGGPLHRPAAAGRCIRASQHAPRRPRGRGARAERSGPRLRHERGTVCDAGDRLQVAATICQEEVGNRRGMWRQ